MSIKTPIISADRTLKEMQLFWILILLLLEVQLLFLLSYACLFSLSRVALCVCLYNGEEIVRLRSYLFCNTWMFLKILLDHILHVLVMLFLPGSVEGGGAHLLHICLFLKRDASSVVFSFCPIPYRDWRSQASKVLHQLFVSEWMKKKQEYWMKQVFGRRPVETPALLGKLFLRTRFWLNRP